MADFKEILVNGQVYKVKDEAARQNAGTGNVTGVKIGDTTYEPTEGGSTIDLSTPLSNKVDKETGKGLSSNDYTTAEKTKLAGIEAGAEANVQPDWNAVSGDAAILNKPTILTENQVQGMIDDAVEDIEAGDTVVIDSDGANIIDEHNNNSVLLAPSARQMKLMYENILAIYNGLANIAFTNGKPTLNWIGSKTKYALSYGTLTGCTADVTAGQVDEGGLRIKLTPTQSSYAFTSVLVNGDSVVPVATGDADGSVYVDIIVNQDITVVATAISGYGVSLASGSNCSLSPASVTPNSTYNGVLSPNQHYTLPSSISATMDGSPITFGGNSGNSYDSSTGAIVISNVTGAVVITASASLMQNITVTLDGTNVVFKHGDDVLTGSVTLYEDDKPYTINVKPQSGYSMTAPTATGCTIVPDEDDGYNVTIPTTVTSALTISATASMPTTLTLNTKWFQDPATEPTIEAGVPFSLELTPMTDFVAVADQAAITANDGAISIPAGEVKAGVQVLMNNVDISTETGVVTFDKSNDKVTIAIANPNGAVVINATARLKIKVDNYIYSDGTVQAHSGAKGWGAVLGTVPIPTSLLNSAGNANEIKNLRVGFGSVNLNAYIYYLNTSNSYVDREKASLKLYSYSSFSYVNAVKFKISVYLSVATGATSDEGLPYVNGNKNGGDIITIISKDDYSNALYVS